MEKNWKKKKTILKVNKKNDKKIAEQKVTKITTEAAKNIQTATKLRPRAWRMGQKWKKIM